MDNSPRIGINAFMGFEPLGKAPVHITTAHKAVPNAPRLNNPMIYVFTNSGTLRKSTAATIIDITTAQENNVESLFLCGYF